MLKLTPLLLALLYGIAMYQISAWRTKRDLDARSTELADPKLKSVFDRIAQVLDLERLKVFIFEIEPVNGLAAPDGRIFLTRGFYDKYRRGEVTDTEIASVIAHELGHVALGHSRRRMLDFSGQNAVRLVLGTVLGRFLPGIGMWLASLLLSLLSAKLSRKDEFEADAYAAAVLTKAGIGVDPQVSLLKKLDRLAGSGRPTVAWLASHPDNAARINAIESRAAIWSAQRTPT